MDPLAILNSAALQKAQTIQELQECNEITLRFGLYLSDRQINDLVEKRFQALQATGRIEFGKGILKKLLCTFADSPYIMQDHYEEIIWELLDIFYYFKNESLDLIGDDDLIAIMKDHFDTICQGSLEYLGGTTLDDLCRDTRFGRLVQERDKYRHDF